MSVRSLPGWKYLTKWENCPISEATWEPISIFIEPSESPDGFTINPALQEFAVEKHPALLDVARKFGRRLIAQSSHPPGKLSVGETIFVNEHKAVGLKHMGCPLTISSGK